MNARGVMNGAWLILALFIACSNKGTENDTDDGNSPYNIQDLRVSNVTANSVTLTWTATGDDANQGTASQYDMRVFDEEITNATWDSAYQLTGEPSPRPAGQIDSMTVTGLSEDSTYFFSLMACDEAGNCSWRSNCARATCFNDYIVTFPDTGLEAAVRRMIEKPAGDIHRIDLMAFIFLDGNNAGIADLAGLEHCTNLETIFASGNSISDLAPLAGLWRLLSIQMVGNNIGTFSSVAGLPNLQQLVLRANPLSDISPVSGMTSLHWLDLSQCGLSDIAPLVANSGLAVGDTVYVVYNPLSQEALNTQIPALEARGVTVFH